MADFVQRYLSEIIRDDLNKKMVFIGGPRQVGKTTLAQGISPYFGYLNWDNSEHRDLILRDRLPNQKLIVLDELHKYRKWRGWIKGKFDTLKSKHQFMVTGSARLDYYRFGGDSLQGRYFYHRLHPFSVKELKIITKEDFAQLFTLGGFPEPFLSGNHRDYKRWSRDYRTRLLRDDLTPLEVVEDLGSLEQMMIRLPDLVGSPLSINALREDLQKSHKTVARWLDIFERVYGIFRVSPFGGPRIRAVKQEQKHYHFDWGLCDKAGPKLENLVACHLLKTAHFIEDTEGDSCELRYFRDSDGREVDFVFLRGKKPTYFVEVKTGTTTASPHLVYLKRKYPEVESFQLHMEKSIDYISREGIRICPAWVFLQNLEA